jgi:hypothetical protein
MSSTLKGLWHILLSSKKGNGIIQPIACRYYFLKNMTVTIAFDTLPIRAQAYLKKLTDSVVGVLPVETNTWRFFTNTLSEHSEPPAILSEVSHWAEKKNIYLYTICLVTQQCNISELIAAFSKAKNTKKNDRAYPRLNHISRCFYVGSSQDLPGRLKQHLGYGPKGTFALQLAHWANTFELELEFQCAKYQSGLAAEVYQILEDTLWEDMSPMFGRKGMK